MVQWVTGVGHDRHLSVSVNAPSSLVVGTVDDANGQINFEAEETVSVFVCVLLLQEASHKVENYVFHMFRYYSFGRMRKSADYYLLQSNSQYITWWSTALSLLIITSGYLQLLFLKRLFTTKTCTEDEKPRC
ncbi:Transmembrane emp24 domain-containing protein 6 [Larimichthys crocea]|uniref:Uncharacterized protein n=1 Tax=Larimichthys crocea TaxID=215358 RepID=A0ACD3QFX7_LARCR|nr:Transmembrane emp24 domain-containing protein 6 [Larimichthys crocea]